MPRRAPALRGTAVLAPTVRPGGSRAGTRSAVRWFQQKYIGASAVDGIVGPRTWDAL
ncbi:peptidoglycan-binding domain-containing protein, partial [Streptomyces albidoflavus]|uniref:peptidoglycan-binding domain-containing protein n=1 Tax=Streptomyces albidoflavus TaxID=1886 RepID=UPI0033D134F8